MKATRPVSLLLSTLYPESCVCPVCNEEALLGDDGLCGACREKLRLCIAPACPAGLDGFRAGLVYNEAAQGPVHRFKYGSALYLADFLASYMEIPAEWEADCLLPVPLHPRKRRKRMYNQSEILALALQKRFPLPMRIELLARVKNTRSQTEMDGARRLDNLKGAFRASPSVSGLRVVLVDDVATTRATLLACAAALREGGAARVYAVSACASN